MRRWAFAAGVTMSALLVGCTSPTREPEPTRTQPAAWAAYRTWQSPSDQAQYAGLHVVGTDAAHGRAIDPGRDVTGISCSSRGELLWGALAREGHGVIRSSAPDGSGARTVLAGRLSLEAPQWAPEGHRFAYVAAHPHLRYEVRVGRRILTSFWSDTGSGDLSWSPDATMLVVVHRTGADEAGEFLAILEVIEVNTARVVGRFTWRTTSVKLSGWTPDSRTLLVIASREVPQPGWYPGPASDRIPDGRLVLVPVRGGPVHALRGPAYRNVGWAAPAPDGGSLAFGSGRRHQDTIDPARYRLRLAAADGSAVRTVSSEQVRWTDGAAWSPDSRHLLLVGHGRSGQGHLWLLDRNGDVVRQLARGQFLGDPVWCPGTPR